MWCAWGVCWVGGVGRGGFTLESLLVRKLELKKKEQDHNFRSFQNKKILSIDRIFLFITIVVIN
jgi:hypothetical protein